jgi:Lon protease-like protein
MSVIESLALFPLSDVVLLPEVSVPLYIFEPRYRQMARDALAGRHQIGMITVRPGAVDAIAGDPPIFDIGCLGQIVHSQERPDGTFQIMLLGVSRFRILKEDDRANQKDDQLYRSAKVELLQDREPATPDEIEEIKLHRNELLSLLEQFVRRIGSVQDPEKTISSFAKLESPRLVNALTGSIPFSPIERQQLLEADSILGRFETMHELLRFQLAALGAGQSARASLPN